MRKFTTSTTLILLSAGACTDDQAQAPGPGVDLTVAPLRLANIDEACYGITIYNGDPALLNDPVGSNDPNIVVQLSQICSGAYGNGPGGAISYVAPCDASVSPTKNYVALTLTSLRAGGATLADQTVAGAAAQFQNPCPGSAPCVLDFECRENEDVPVVFDLTIMRPANQGFFDIAVNFEDIFCSAKLDTCYDGGEGPDEPIELLFGHPTAGATTTERGWTAVMALACTAGPSAIDKTLLYMSPITIACPGQQPIVLDPSAGPGNALATPGVFGQGIWQYAVYEGQEAIPCGTTSCDKVYWNVALGIEGLPNGCTLSASATATDHVLVGGALPRDASYPEIRYTTQLTGEQGIVCAQNELDENPGHGVHTDYKDIGEAGSFGFELTQTITGVDTHPIVIAAPPDAGGNEGSFAIAGAIPKGPPGVTVGDQVGPQDVYDLWRFEAVSGRKFAVTCSGNAAIAWTFSMPGANGAYIMSGVCDGTPVPSGETVPNGFYNLALYGGALAQMSSYTVNVVNLN